MADAKLDVVRREEFGKGAARRYRREGKIPSVLYGHGTEPIHLLLDAHPTMLALRTQNALLKLENPDTGKSELALAKDVQTNPVTREIEHLDLLIVKKGEKVEVDIPVVLAGEAVSPAVAMVDLQALTLSVDALKVPEQIEIDVEGKEEGYQLFAGDVVLPGDAELVTDAEILVVSVMVPHVAEEDLEPVVDEDAEGETETEAEGAESSEGSEEE